MNILTAKDIDTNLKSSSKFKKIFTYTGHTNPVIPITASTYKTGKHGSGKTRLLMKDFFTDSSFSDILDTDEKFTELESNVNYSVELGVVTNVSDTQVTVINESYETITVQEKNSAIIKLCKDAEHITYCKFFNGINTLYKIKSVGQTSVY